MAKGESCLALKYHLNLKRRKTFKFSMGVSISKAFRLLTATGIFKCLSWKYLRKYWIIRKATLMRLTSRSTRRFFLPHWVFSFRRTIVTVRVIHWDDFFTTFLFSVISSSELIWKIVINCHKILLLLLLFKASQELVCTN